MAMNCFISNMSTRYNVLWQAEVEVDEEGYRIRPDNPLENNGDKTSWNSSDSDSDSGKW